LHYGYNLYLCNPFNNHENGVILGVTLYTVVKYVYWPDIEYNFDILNTVVKPVNI
jgi:hypothetical protein